MFCLRLVTTGDTGVDEERVSAAISLLSCDACWRFIEGVADSFIIRFSSSASWWFDVVDSSTCRI